MRRRRQPVDDREVQIPDAFQGQPSLLLRIEGAPQAETNQVSDCDPSHVRPAGQDSPKMPRIFSVRDYRSYLGDEPIADLLVCRRVPPLVVIKMDDLWLKLRELAAAQMHRQWEEVIPPGRTEYQLRLCEGGHVAAVCGEEVVPVEIWRSWRSELGNVESSAEEHLAGSERCHSLSESSVGWNEHVC